MLSTSNWSSSASSLLPRRHHNNSIKKTRASSFLCLTIGVDHMAEFLQNKVLVAAAISTVIGQLTKPFTTSLLYGENINLRRFVGAGGFPSSHSAGVVAAATSLGLERGFSDSIFGMSVIFAVIVMYDAQAVRWEVGKHAKILNKKVVSRTQNKSIVNSYKGDGTSILTKSEALDSPLPNSERRSNPTLNSAETPLYVPSKHRSSALSAELAIDYDHVSEVSYNTSTPLEESIGHTEVEVIAGSLLGFLVTLAVYNVI